MSWLTICHSQFLFIEVETQSPSLTAELCWLKLADWGWDKVSFRYSKKIICMLHAEMVNRPIQKELHNRQAINNKKLTLLLIRFLPLTTKVDDGRVHITPHHCSAIYFVPPHSMSGYRKLAAAACWDAFQLSSNLTI